MAPLISWTYFDAVWVLIPSFSIALFTFAVSISLRVHRFGDFGEHHPEPPAFDVGLGALAWLIATKIGEALRGLKWHFDPTRLLKGESPVWVTTAAGELKAAEEATARSGGKGRFPWEKRTFHLLHPFGHPSRPTHPLGASGVFGQYGHAQHGARVLAPGAIEVGEMGPEAVSLPQGATVAPLEPGSWQSGDIVINVDGKALARVSRRQALLAQAAGAG